MQKGTVMQGTYEKFSANGKSGIAKLATKYGAFSTVRHCTKIRNWPDCPLKEGTLLVDKLKIALFN